MKIKEVNFTDYEQIIRNMDKQYIGSKLDPKGYWWIVLDNNEVVGYAGMSESNRYSNCGYFTRCTVLPKYRGKGLQRRLIRARLKKAKKLNWAWIFTYTVIGNVHSENNLIECGFRLFIPKLKWIKSNTVNYWRKQVQ